MATETEKNVPELTLPQYVQLRALGREICTMERDLYWEEKGKGGICTRGDLYLGGSVLQESVLVEDLYLGTLVLRRRAKLRGQSCTWGGKLYCGWRELCRGESCTG